MWVDGLPEFFALFHIAFTSAARAPRWDDMANALRWFAELPVEDLQQLARLAGLDPDELKCEQWGRWLGGRRHDLMVEVIGLRRWWVGVGDPSDYNPTVVLSREAQAVFGLVPWEQCILPPKRDNFTVQSDRSVIAGVDVPAHILATMIKYSKVRKLGDVCEMSLDPKKIKENVNAADELKQVLGGVDDLPDTVRTLISPAHPPAPPPSVQYLYCSMIIKSDAADAIAKHTKLKNYVARKLGPGYLVIKSESNPDRFLKRCRECGYTVEPL